MNLICIFYIIYMLLKYSQPIKAQMMKNLYFKQVHQSNQPFISFKEIKTTKKPTRFKLFNSLSAKEKGFKTREETENNPQFAYTRELSLIELRQQYPRLDLQRFFTKSFMETEGRSVYLSQEENAKVLFQSSQVETDERAQSDLLYSYTTHSQISRDIAIMVYLGYIEANRLEDVSVFVGQGQCLAKAMRIGKSKELGQYVSGITVVDRKINLVDSLGLLVELNDLDRNRFKAELSTAYQYLFQSEEEFDIIDLEFHDEGTEHLPCAFQAIKDGGMVSFFFSDLQLENLGFPQKLCYNQEAANRFACPYEDAIRHIYQQVQRVAQDNGCAIKPLFFETTQAYPRVYFQVSRTQQPLSEKHTLFCTFCPYHLPVPQGVLPPHDACPHCQSPLGLVGPYYAGDIIDLAILSQASAVADSHLRKLRNHRFLRVILDQHQKYFAQKHPTEVNFYQFLKTHDIDVSNLKPFILGTFEHHGYSIHESSVRFFKWVTNADLHFCLDFLKTYSADFLQQTDHQPMKNFLTSQRKHQIELKAKNDFNQNEYFEFRRYMFVKMKQERQKTKNKDLTLE